MKDTNQNLLEQARQIVSLEAAAIATLADQFTASINDVVRLLFECQGHVLVTGAGTSRAIAQRFAHLLSCSGTPALFINAADSLHGGSGAITGQDVVYIISKGGHSREINAFAEIAKNRGAKLIAHTENPDSPLAKLCDAVFQVKAPVDVDPYGMIATGSSLVNGAACDVLCIILLEKRGYTKDQFGVTHPEGAVGIKIANGK